MTKLSKFLSIILVISLVLMVRSFILDENSYQGQIDLPIQNDIKEDKEILYNGSEGEVRLLPRASYDITGVVKSKKKYFDFASQVSDYDLAIAWGNLNKDEIDSFIKYSQGGRWYYYVYKAETPVSKNYISDHSANVHIIHKNKEVLSRIEKINEGDLIQLKGFLVDVDFENTNNIELWKTSRTRNDTGNGSCEILYVEEVNIIK